MILNYISFPVLIISFLLGLLFLYILGPKKKTIYVYPTPENIDKILFKDKANNCFHFNEMNVECPSDISNIFSVPIQS
jgi:hypothetical protein